MGQDPVMHLREMGLSDYEATAYASLLRQGTATAKEISSHAEIPQSRVYDVLESLETKGFVVIQPGRPKKFGPVRPTRATEQFCDHKQRQHAAELDDIRSHGERLQQVIDRRETPQTGTDALDVAWSYSNRHHILEKLADLCSQADDEILIVTTPLSFERILNHHTGELRHKAEAGVTIRALVADDRPVDDAVLATATDLMEIGLVETIEGRLYMYDEENILLAFQDPDGDGYVGVSTGSSHLSRTFSYLFELMWADSDHLTGDA